MSSLALALALAVTGASTPSAGDFGRRGDIIISVDRLLPLFDYESEEVTVKGTNVTNTQSTSQSAFSFLWGGSPDLSTGWFNTPRIGADFVVADRITVGGELAYFTRLGGETEDRTETAGQVTTTKADLPDLSGVGFALRGGYLLSFGKGLSLWPRAGLAYYTASEKLETPAAGLVPATVQETTLSQTTLNVEALAAYSPVDNVVITAGPVLDIPIDGSYEDSTRSGTTTVSTKGDYGSFHLGLTIGLAFYL